VVTAGSNFFARRPPLKLTVARRFGLPCCSASGQLDLLGLLRRLLTEATAPELDLSSYASGSSSVSGGGQVVAAGWHAAAVTARLCGAQQQQLQDAAVARGLLPLLAKFLQTEVPAPVPGGAWGAPGTAASAATAADAARVAEQLMAIK
jgi:hypothetical protein